jgi:hypothetical protein
MSRRAKSALAASQLSVADALSMPGWALCNNRILCWVVAGPEHLSDAIGGQYLRSIETCAGLCAVDKVLVKFCFTKVVGERNTCIAESTLCHVSAPSNQH